MQIDERKTKILMAERLLGISDLSKMSGLSDYSISRALNGKTNPNTKTIGRIAKALNVDIEKIIKSEE